MAKILILGAGVVGVATAYYLKENGNEVMVVDAAADAGSGASFANGAQLSYSKTYPLSNPHTLKIIPRMIFGGDSPIHIKRLDLELISWGLKFLGQSTHKNAEKNAKEVLDIALRSRELMHALVQRHEIHFDYARKGKMFIFTSQFDFDDAKKVADKYTDLGVTQRILTPEQAVAVEPALYHIRQNLVGAIYSEIDESGDARKFSMEMVRILQSEGVNFVFGKRLEDIVTENRRIKRIGEYEADIFVNCLGVASNKIFGKVGVKLPIYPMKGYSLTMPATGKSPEISITDEARKIVYSKIGDRLRVAGIAEFAGHDLSIDEKIVGGMVDSAKATFPEAADYSNITKWAGLRPMTPSTVPIIGRSEKFENLYLNTGHGMLGWTLALGSAKKLAEKIS
jgi:D-amino-acid dehydrogenase